MVTLIIYDGLRGNPALVEPAAQANKRYFKEAGTYEFEGMVFTGLIDDNKIPGFIAQEVCDELGYEDQHGSTRYIPERYKGWSQRQTPGGLQDVRVLDERGFYQLILNAERTPKVERFQDWVYCDVLPSIRETGSYFGKPQIEAPKVDAMAALSDPDFVLALIARRDQEKKLLEQEVAAKVEVIEKKERMIEYKDRQIQNTNKQLIQNCTLPSPYSKRLC